MNALAQISPVPPALRAGGRTAFAAPGWDKGLAFGLDSIDYDHSVIYTAMSLVEHEFRLGRRAAEIEKTVRFLSSRVEEHFHREEAIMNLLAYPDAEYHQAEHQHYRGTVTPGIAAIPAEARATADLGVLRDAVAWWGDHIQGADRRFANYVVDLFGPALFPRGEERPVRRARRADHAS